MVERVVMGDFGCELLQLGLRLLLVQGFDGNGVNGHGNLRNSPVGFSGKSANEKARSSVLHLGEIETRGQRQVV